MNYKLIVDNKANQCFNVEIDLFCVQIYMQYYSRLFGLVEETEHHKLIYVESEPSESLYGFDLLSTHLIDSMIGDLFFGDANRMHSDLLGPAATEYLDKLFPQKMSQHLLHQLSENFHFIVVLLLTIIISFSFGIFLGRRNMNRVLQKTLKTS